MYASPLTKLIVGIFALLGIAALAALSFRLGQVEIFSKPSYTLFANFDNISGLKSGDQVQIAGVDVGKVTGIGLNDNRAHVKLRIDRGVEIDDDAIASVKTSGIIGDKYIAIALGPSDKNLADGATIRHTQSAFVLEDAIGQLINSSGSGSSSSEPKAGGGGAPPGISNPPGVGSNCNCNQPSKGNS